MDRDLAGRRGQAPVVVPGAVRLALGRALVALGADEVRPDLDAVISMRARGWSLSRLNAVDRNLLRLALYEMLLVDDVDVPITIDECVELAKAYGTDESSRFVNGVLGRVADDLEAGVDVVAAAREAARACRRA